MSWISGALSVYSDQDPLPLTSSTKFLFRLLSNGGGVKQENLIAYFVSR